MPPSPNSMNTRKLKLLRQSPLQNLYSPQVLSGYTRHVVCPADFTLRQLLPADDGQRLGLCPFVGNDIPVSSSYKGLRTSAVNELDLTS